MDLRVWRVLDANANRAAEGLRTLEEVARFLKGDAHWAETLKSLRHQLCSSTELLDREKRLSARSTETDVGTQLTADSERDRKSVGPVIAAEVERVGQALRALEEFSKLVDPTVSQRFKALRYEAYDQFAQFELAMVHHAWLDNMRLCILIDCQLPLSEFESYLKQLGDAGAKCFQIRDKVLEGKLLCDYARRAVEILRAYNGHVIVNDRVDVALASEASGVHVGQEDLSIEHVRAIAGHRLCVGVSTHDIVQAKQAAQAGADYIGCGPTFPSRTKSFEHFPGVDFLSEVAGQIPCPALAIGGISLDNLDQVLHSGVQGVAVTAAIHQAKDPAQAVREFCSRLNLSDH